MLVNLQRRLKPKDDVRRLQLADQYRELQRRLRTRTLTPGAWINSWKKVYREGVKLSQPIVLKDTTVQDFLRAVFDTAPDFASCWTNTIQNTLPTTTINAQGETIRWIPGLIFIRSSSGFEFSARSCVRRRNLALDQPYQPACRGSSRGSRKQDRNRHRNASVDNAIGSRNAYISTGPWRLTAGREILRFGRRLTSN